MDHTKTGIKEKQHSPTLYEYYVEGGITTGLIPTQTGEFLLNGRKFRLLSGAIHYFRVHPVYWRDRLRKLRACGLNAVETYVPWNLHEPQKGVFDFGNGANDMSIFLDLISYIKIAQEEDVFVILRPGPYICAEWEFGGLPSWLLRDLTMQIRSSYPLFIERASIFLDQIIPLVRDLQFTSGGSIIAVQVENEYGAFGYGDQPRDKNYMQTLLDKMKSLGIKEMFLTSDYVEGTLDWGAIPGVLQTANFQYGASDQFRILRDIQPRMPLMVTEFWTGWFDHWGQGYHDGGLSNEDFAAALKEVLNHEASINFYMFHGGTSFGFMNGANVQREFPHYLPDVTSYDYDAPLTEAGDYSAKYDIISECLKLALPVMARLPDRPSESKKKAFKALPITSYLTLGDLIDQVPVDMLVNSPTVLSMEDLPINNFNGQSYGFTVYRKIVNVQSNSVLKVRNHFRDFAQVLIDGQLQTPPILTMEDLAKNFGSWYPRDSSFTFGSWRALTTVSDHAVLDIIVENMGRVNYGKPHDFKQKKGLWEGPVLLDGTQLSDWQIVPLEFKTSWINQLKNWKRVDMNDLMGPVAVRFSFEAEEQVDTFLDMTAWGKGVVFVNGFNLGRYWSTMGPQKALYLPGPLLKVDSLNTIIVYEQYSPATWLSFSAQPILGEKIHQRH